MSKQHSDPRYYSNSLARGLKILTLFNVEEQSLSLAEIAKLIGVSRTVPYRLLYTLEQLGYLSQEERSKRYRLTPKVLELGFSYLNSIEFSEIAQPYLDSIRDEFNTSCHLSILDGTDVVYIGTATVHGISVLNVRLGLRLQAHSVANGRVLLAHQSKEYLTNHYNDETIKNFTEYPIEDLDAFFNMLNSIKENGYGITADDFMLGVSSVSVPIFDNKNNIKAALNIVGTTEQLNKDFINEALPRIKEVANILSTNPKNK